MSELQILTCTPTRSLALFRTIAAVGVLLVAAPIGAAAATTAPSLAAALPQLHQQIAVDLAREKLTTIAIFPLTDERGTVSKLGRWTAEGLAKYLRQHHVRVVEEHKLRAKTSETGSKRETLLDEIRTANVATGSGADGLVRGRLRTRGNQLEVLLETRHAKDGSLSRRWDLSVPLTPVLTSLLDAESEYWAGTAEPRVEAVARSATTRDSPAGSAVGEFFAESFEGLAQGDPIATWGKNLFVAKGPGDRLYLSAQTPGLHSAVRQLEFPDDFSFEFDWTRFQDARLGRGAPYSRIRFELLDKSGDWVSIECGADGARLPGQPLAEIKARNLNTFRLEKRGSLFKLYNNGEFVQSAVLDIDGPFRGFRLSVPVSKEGTGQMFTRFLGERLPPGP